jgi:uncharacterized lipoprotein YmbA
MRQECVGGSVLVAIVIALAGCGTSPDPSYYTLSAGAEPTANTSEGPYSVVVGPVSLPDLVDRPQLVIRVGENRVAVVEQHRWAEPLRSEIPRVIADNLSRLLSTTRISTYPQGYDNNAEYRVLIDIQRFESVPRENVTVEALWAVRRGPASGVRTGRSLVRMPAGAKGYDALAAAHARALSRMSEEIAEVIRGMQSAPR